MDDDAKDEEEETCLAQAAASGNMEAFPQPFDEDDKNGNAERVENPKATLPRLFNPLAAHSLGDAEFRIRGRDFVSGEGRNEVSIERLATFDPTEIVSHLARDSWTLSKTAQIR